jgi:O-antigen/teichoic acid export membrane protein
MGIVIKQSFRTSIVTYLGFLVGVVNTLWLSPLLLTEEQIGLVRVLINLTVLLATFASLGALQIPMRFFPYFKDVSNKHNGFLFFLLVVGSAGFILFVVLLIVFKDLFASVFGAKSKMLVDYYLYLLPLTFLNLYISIFHSYLTIQQKPVFPNFIREFLLRFLTTAALLLLFFEFFTFENYINLLVVIYAVNLILIVFYTRRVSLLFLKPDLYVFRSPLLKDIAVFGLFVIMGNASGSIINNIDSLMLSAYSGLKSAGVYNIAFYIAAVIEVPRRALSQSIIPTISEANKNKDYGLLKKVYSSSSINQLIIGGWLFLIIWCNVDNIFNIMPNGHLYAGGKQVILLIGLGKVFDLMTGVNAEILGTSDYYKIDLFFYSLLAIMTVYFNNLFIPIWGINGAAAASALAIFIFNSIRYLFIYWKFRIQPFSLNTLKVILIGIIILYLNSITSSLDSGILDLIIRTAVCSLAFGALIIFLKLSEELTDIYNFTVRKFFK